MKIVLQGLNLRTATNLPKVPLYMDWESAKNHCKERNWKWTLNFIDKCQKEMEDLESENKKLKDQQKADRLFNACNY